MKKYVASTPNAEVIGAALMAYKESVHRDEFYDVLKENNLTQIDPEQWYPQQLTLDIQERIKNMDGGGNHLISIGMKIIETAKFPPMESLEAALGAFAQSYPMNFRNHAEDDIIIAKQIDDTHIQVINSSPHSDEMIYGYVYAMVKRFAPSDIHPIVQFEDYKAIDSDGNTVINVSW